MPRSYSSNQSENGSRSHPISRKYAVNTMHAQHSAVPVRRRTAQRVCRQSQHRIISPSVVSHGGRCTRVRRACQSQAHSKGGLAAARRQLHSQSIPCFERGSTVKCSPTSSTARVRSSLDACCTLRTICTLSGNRPAEHFPASCRICGLNSACSGSQDDALTQIGTMVLRQCQGIPPSAPARSATMHEMAHPCEIDKDPGSPQIELSRAAAAMSASPRAAV